MRCMGNTAGCAVALRAKAEALRKEVQVQEMSKTIDALRKDVAVLKTKLGRKVPTRNPKKKQ